MIDCSKIEDQLLLYLLGELPPEEMMEVGRHLQACSQCPAEMNRTAADITKISAAFKAVPDCLDESFAGRIVSRLPSHERPKGFLRSRWSYAAAALAACLLLVALALSYVSNTSHGGDIQVSGLLADHREYLDKPNPAQVISADPKIVASWLSAKLGFSVSAMDLSRQGVTLLGGRRCELNGVPLAFLFYEKNGTRISLYEIEGTRVHLENLETRLCDGHRLYFGRYGSTRLVACRSGERTLVVIAELEIEELVEIAQGAAMQGRSRATRQAAPPVSKAPLERQG